MKTPSRFHRLVIFAFGTVFAAVVVQGETYTWTGGTGAWDDATHWQIDGAEATQAPGEGDDVLLPAPEDTTGNYTVTATGAINVRHFTIGAEDDSHLGTVTFVSQTKDTHQVAGDLQVLDKGVLMHAMSGTAYKLNLSVAGNADIQSGGTINVTAKGYGQDSGPGYGGTGGSSGGSYGGYGSGGTVPKCYGSIRCPIDAGSGGMRANQYGTRGGYGGGAVHLTVAGTLNLDGSIYANGDDADWYYAGGGSGGSIWLDVGALTGGGMISAVGGRLSGTYGGGGRIAIYQRKASEMAFDRAKVNANNGTIYLQNQGDAEGRGELLIRKGVGNRSIFKVQPDAAEGEPDGDQPFGKITYEGSASSELCVLDGIVMPVSCDILLGVGKLTAANGGGIDFCPASSCTVSGTFEVDTLVCTNADAAVEFLPGSALTVHANGTMRLLGEKDHPLTLLSAEPLWNISINEGVAAQVKYVAASNSVVLVGSVSDTEGSDLGGNTGWTFPKETVEGTEIYWTGAAGTADWGTAGNWVDEFDQVRVPKASDAIVIADGCDPYPTLSTSMEVYSLTIGAGAVLRTVNSTLAVTHDVSLAAGSLLMDADSTFMLAGAGEQTADMGGNAVRYLVVDSSSVTFLNGFSTYSFTCEQEGDVALRFSAGDTYSMSVCRVIAADGKTVSLDSTAEDSPWYLKAGAGAIFTNVSVKDSDASKGATIATVDFDDRGNNRNWDKGACIWKGTSTTWTDPNNWIGGVPGDSNDVILVSATAQPTISSAMTLRSLAVGDGVSAMTLTVNGALTVCRGLTVGEWSALSAAKGLVVSNDLIFAENSTFTSQTVEPHRVGGSCYVHSGTKMTHPATPRDKSDKTYALNLDVGGDMIVEKLVNVDVNQCGFQYGRGPGAGGRNQTAVHASRGSAGAKACYGSIRAPMDLGSGCESQFSGGGAVWFSVAGELRFDGTISANGTSGWQGCTSGGSVRLTVGKLTGSGTATANGGTYGASYAGGGRIALVQTNSADRTAFTGTLSVSRGTLYKEYADDAPGRGTLYVSGDDVKELSRTVGGSDEPFGRIVFTGTSTANTLQVIDGIVVTVCGDVDTAAGKIEATSGGLDLLAADGVAKVSGQISAGALICTNAGTRVEFAAGTTLTVADNGTLRLAGADGQPLTLWSDEPSWTISPLAEVDMDVHHVAVSNSSATAAIGNMSGIDLGGNNANWKFLKPAREGCLVYWRGVGTDGGWSDALNWEDEDGQQRLPKETDAVVIPSGLLNNPTLPFDSEVYAITVEAGASLRIENATLTVTHDVSLAAGSLTMNRTSTFRLAGGSAQTVDCGGNAFARILVESPSVTFLNGFSTYGFSCEQEGDVALRFSAGDTYEAVSIRVVGHALNGVTLDSTAEDSPWYLKAGAGAIFTGVSVKDSDASRGATIATVDFDDRGNNRNWDKGACIWKGTSTTWTDPNNWIGGVPGDSNDVILVSATAQPTISSATAVRSLAVGDGVSAVTLTVNGALTVCRGLTVGEGSALSASKGLVVSNDLVFAESSTFTSRTLEHHWVGGSCRAYFGVKLTHPGNSGSTKSYVLDFDVCGDMTIENGAAINVDGCGYTSGPGVGGRNYNGIHGSRGKNAVDGKVCYGSVRAPVDHGSGSENSSGGGAVWLNVAGELRLDGTISANGSSGGSLGSGGSVCLTVGKLTGSGSVTVNGGVYGALYGGGGRIALVQTNSVDRDASYPRLTGSSGTLYKEYADDAPGRGTLYVSGEDVKDISSSVEDAGEPFGHIVFLGTSAANTLSILNDVVVPVCGDVDAAAGMVTAADGTRGGLDLCATGGVQHVVGTLNLGALVATNGAEEIEFAAGKTVTVADNGVLWLEGSERRKMRLRSSVPDTQWLIVAGTNLTGRVRNLDVRDSDAGGGQTIKAKRSVGRSKRANNRNWAFPSGMALIVK